MSTKKRMLVNLIGTVLVIMGGMTTIGRGIVLGDSFVVLSSLVIVAGAMLFHHLCTVYCKLAFRYQMENESLKRDIIRINSLST